MAVWHNVRVLLSTSCRVSSITIIGIKLETHHHQLHPPPHRLQDKSFISSMILFLYTLRLATYHRVLLVFDKQNIHIFSVEEKLTRQRGKLVSYLSILFWFVYKSWLKKQKCKTQFKCFYPLLLLYCKKRQETDRMLLSLEIGC